VPGTAPGSCLAEMIWSVIGQVAGLGQAGIVDREGERVSDVYNAADATRHPDRRQS